MNNDFSSNTYDKNDDFIDITHDLDKHYIDTIEILRQTVEAKDPYTRGHSDRVSAYSVLLGKKLALPKKDLITLKIGGLFHDIGKIGIPDSILLKESRLTDDEYAQIKMHPIVGVQILGNSDFFYRLANWSKRLGIKFNLAMLYLVDELYQHQHSTFDIHIGKPIPWQSFTSEKSPTAWAAEVRNLVYTLPSSVQH